MDQQESIQKERERYQAHQNQFSDGYVTHLAQIVDPVLALPEVNSNSKFLDYGCGPEPTLAKILRQQGFQCDVYDPLFAPATLDKKYEVVMCTEVIEHFRSPRQDWEALVNTLKPGAVLAIMTQFHQGRPQFESWWYPRDFTHVSFYSEKTLGWLADQFRLSKCLINSPVAILKK